MRDRLALRRAMESCLRMLGWKTINNSMVVDFKTASGRNVDIVLGNKENYGYHVALPVIITTDIYGENIADEVKELASEVGCKSVIALGPTLDLYFKSDDSEDYVCIKKISFDPDNECGGKLANILPASVFDKEQLNSFFKTIYDGAIPTIKLDLVLNTIVANQKKAKDVLKTYLELEGFEGDYVDEKLAEIHVDIYYEGHMVSEPTPQRVSAYTLPAKKSSHDRTKYAINDGPMMTKRRFVYEVVCQFIKEHPTATFEDLERQFPSSITSKERGVVRPYEAVRQWAKEIGDDILKRYFTKEEDIIRLANGMEIVVNNQWGTSNFPNFLRIAKNLYKVTSSETCSEMSSVRMSNLDIYKKRANNFRFSMVGIPIGETIVFDKKNIIVKVVSDNEVEYEGIVYKLSSFVKTFIPDEFRTPSESYRGPDFFSYKGRTLTELRYICQAKLNDIEKTEEETKGKNKGIHISELALNSFKSRQ